MIEYKYVYPSTDKYRMNERMRRVLGRERRGDEEGKDRIG